jgi:hypothetical protein
MLGDALAKSGAFGMADLLADPIAVKSRQTKLNETEIFPQFLNPFFGVIPCCN